MLDHFYLARFGTSAAKSPPEVQVTAPEKRQKSSAPKQANPLVQPFFFLPFSIFERCHSAMGRVTATATNPPAMQWPMSQQVICGQTFTIIHSQRVLRVLLSGCRFLDPCIFVGICSWMQKSLNYSTCVLGISTLFSSAMIIPTMGRHQRSFDP